MKNQRFLEVLIVLLSPAMFVLLFALPPIEIFRLEVALLARAGESRFVRTARMIVTIKDIPPMT